ncbi:MAG: type II toxin-antitoxin system HicB family antitoxin [Actinomycetota bacterium]|nr:type II toxin-antitoxin system HicB family antitoxin [Actinomycetota bacterium]
MTRYLVIYETDDDGGWSAYSPDLPGCYAAAATREEVEQLMTDALPMHIAALRQEGLAIPEPHHQAGTIAA